MLVRLVCVLGWESLISVRFSTVNNLFSWN